MIKNHYLFLTTPHGNILDILKLYTETDVNYTYWNDYFIVYRAVSHHYATHLKLTYLHLNFEKQKTNLILTNFN